jgi:protein-L-isoaspartate(D-aspartate) O-methyltransferase
MPNGTKVYSVERQNELFKQTSILLPKLGFVPNIFLLEMAIKDYQLCSFDSIIVTAGAPFIPQPLMAQLKKGR